MGKAVFSNGKCYVFGGEVSNPAIPANPALGLNALGTYTRVDIYTISTNTWSQGDVRCPFCDVSAIITGFFDLCVHVLQQREKRSNSPWELLKNNGFK